MIALTIRRYERDERNRIRYPSRVDLRKQIITLFKKLSKTVDGLTFGFSIESNGGNNGHHVHIITNMERLDSKTREVLIRFCDGQDSPLQFNRFIRKSELVDEVDGRFGVVTAFHLINVDSYRNYINKYVNSELEHLIQTNHPTGDRS